MTILRFVLLGTIAAALSGSALLAQDSDFLYKEEFLERARAIDDAIVNAGSTQELDSLRLTINSFEAKYSRRKDFLDKALHPESFASTVKELRTHLEDANSKVFVIQSQSTKIENLESHLALLVMQIDSLSIERTKAFNDLRAAQRSNTSLKEAVNRLKATLLAKDNLIFALLDSIFLPFETGMLQGGDVAPMELRRQLEESNALSRVYEIASDNLRFAQVMKLQGRDFVPMVEQYNKFQKRWNVLKDRIAEASEGDKVPAGARGSRIRLQQAAVDSVISEWDGTLMSSLWKGVAGEFNAKGIFLLPFDNGASFKASIDQYLESARIKGSDETVFVEDVWKERIDKEWRSTLTQESVLGQATYAQLDLAVSEFAVKTLDWKTAGAIALVFVIVIGTIILRARRDKKAAAQRPPQG